MIRVSYAEVEADSLADAREREQQLLDQSIEMMEAAIAAGPASMAAIEAMHFTNRIWTYLLDDLASPDNALPSDVRASLISIGIWILRQTDAVRRGESVAIGEIKDITTIIRNGLK